MPITSDGSITSPPRASQSSGCILCGHAKAKNHVICQRHIDRLPVNLVREFQWFKTDRRVEATRDAHEYLELTHKAARDAFVLLRAESMCRWATAEMAETRADEWREIEHARYLEQNAKCEGRR